MTIKIKELVIKASIIDKAAEHNERSLPKTDTAPKAPVSSLVRDFYDNDASKRRER